MSQTNERLNTAKKAKNDEFYSRYEDIEKEIVYYKEQLKGKIIYCPCDTRNSNFYKYFKNNFESLQLKKLIISSLYDNTIVYDGVNETVLSEQNIDCFSDTAKKHFEESDIVITNPPFSLFRKFYTLLKSQGKEFLIIGALNAITYKDIFPDIKSNQIAIGVSNCIFFDTPSGLDRVYCIWYTSLNVPVKTKMKLTATYDPQQYPSYDNYEAININKCKEIPKDYAEAMGVPISFLEHYCKEQFEILDARDFALNDKCKSKTTPLIKDKEGTAPGLEKAVYARILIRRIDLPSC